MKTGCIRLLYVGVFGLFVGGVFVLVIYFFVELDVVLLFTVFCGEFDPGSGRTLAACLTHASRTMKPASSMV
ncbi:hypothetical protein [Actinotignum timonense]|uniref:hypothetical protein n=1 Tax=Actinotignum timonense TaxID=1870995 RepID=UPI0037D78437